MHMYQGTDADALSSNRHLLHTSDRHEERCLFRRGCALRRRLLLLSCLALLCLLHLSNLLLPSLLLILAMPHEHATLSNLTRRLRRLTTRILPQVTQQLVALWTTSSRWARRPLTPAT